MNVKQSWGEQYIINYFWQKTAPDYKESGKGALYYDAKAQCFAVHNIYEGGDIELRYILNVKQKMSYIVSTENKHTTCKKYPTERKLLPLSFLEDMVAIISLLLYTYLEILLIQVLMLILLFYFSFLTFAYIIKLQ